MEPISSQLEPGRSVTLAIQFVPKTALNYACKLVGVPDHFPVQYPMDSNDPSCLNPQPGHLPRPSVRYTLFQLGCTFPTSPASDFNPAPCTVISDLCRCSSQHKIRAICQSVSRIHDSMTYNFLICKISAVIPPLGCRFKALEFCLVLALTDGR